jgi:hypothetical protein
MGIGCVCCQSPYQQFLDFVNLILLFSPQPFPLLLLLPLLFPPQPLPLLEGLQQVSRKPEQAPVLPVLPPECYLHSFVHHFSRWH